MNVGKSSGAGRKRYAATPMAEINIIPLVDVTLVILIIFMVTMSFDKEKPGDPVVQLPIVLPKSNAATDKAIPGDLLILGLDKTGKKYIGDSPATTESVIQKVRETAKNPNARVRIDADQDARYRDVIELVEMCQFEGLRNVGLRTTNK